MMVYFKIVFNTYAVCSGLLHFKPRNTNLQQYPLVIYRISCASRERKVKRWLCINCDQYEDVRVRARGSEMGETPNQRAKRDIGNLKGKSVLAHMSGLYMEVAAAI